VVPAEAAPLTINDIDAATIPSRRLFLEILLNTTYLMFVETIRFTGCEDADSTSMLITAHTLCHFDRSEHGSRHQEPLVCGEFVN
jgi:hypothetical protein